MSRKQNIRFSRPVIFSLTLALCAQLVSCSKSNENETKKLIEAPTVPEEEMLENAVRAYDRGLFSVAKKEWEDLKDGYPGSYFTVLAEIKSADSYFYLSDYATAQIQYEEFLRLHPGHEAAPYVRYQLANCNLEQYRGPKHDQIPLQLAIKGFRVLIAEYPDSEYALEARKKLDQCREKLAEHESYVAGFYLNQGNVKASAERLRRLNSAYADSEAARTTRVNLQEDYPEEIPQVDTELQKPASPIKLKGEKPESPPQPQFAYLAPDFVPGAGAVQTESVPSAPIILTSNPDMSEGSPNVPDINASTEMGLTCEKSDGLEIFVLTLKEPFKILQPKASGTEITFSLISFGARNFGFAAGDKPTSECALENTSFVSRFDPVVESKMLSVQLNSSEKSRYTFLQLDRPHRLVIVSRPQTIQ